MINDIINVGIPSKGRLRKDVLNIFKKNKLKLISKRGDRDLFGSIKGKKNIQIIYLHAREIIERLADKSLDMGFSGLDLLKESEINIQKNIKLEKKLNFGFATLVLACRNEFIDLFTTLDLDEVAEDYKKKVNELRSSVSSLQKERNNLLETVSKQRNKAKTELLKALNPIISNYMKEKNIRMVIDKKNLLLADDGLDITKDIINLFFGEKYNFIETI